MKGSNFSLMVCSSLSVKGWRGSLSIVGLGIWAKGLTTIPASSASSEKTSLTAGDIFQAARAYQRLKQRSFNADHLFGSIFGFTAHGAVCPLIEPEKHLLFRNGELLRYE